MTRATSLTLQCAALAVFLALAFSFYSQIDTPPKQEAVSPDTAWGR